MINILKKLQKAINLLLEFIGSWKFFTLILGHFIIVGLLLFASKFLGIDTLYYPAELITDSGQTLIFSEREVGYFWAINWTFYFIFIMPSYFVLFHIILSSSKEFCEKIYLKKMIVYTNNEGRKFNLDGDQFWDVVIKTSSIWILIVFAISISAGVVQWYQYSGQWYISGFDLDRFLTVSTGVDWNVAGSIGSPNHNNGFFITTFALVNYLYYGVGWALMFAFYILLLVFFIELYKLSKSRSDENDPYLVADKNDVKNAGFKIFGKIQSSHAIFSLVSILSLYLMSLRNNYLTHQCRVPSLLEGSPNQYDHCKHLVNLMLISKDLVKPIIESGVGAIKKLPSLLDALFFNYVPQNTWTLGPFFNIAFICAFFIIISWLMKSVILAAKDSLNIDQEDFASEILDRLKKNWKITLFLFLLGGVGALFTNVGSLMIIGMILWPIKLFIDYTKKNLLNFKKFSQWLRTFFS